MEEKIDVSIIYCNYFTSTLLKDSLESLVAKSTNFKYEIIVVDNSNDEVETKKLLKLKINYPNLILIDAKTNLGFGKANNLGSKYARGKYLYFLNTDTLLLNNAIYELFAFMKKNKEVGICGSNLFNSNLKPYHSFIKSKKNLYFERKNGSLIHALFFKLLKRDDFNYSSKPLKIKGYVCGASLMILKDDFIKLNGFDQDIFMYSEEALLCYQLIKKLRKEIYNVPSSKIIHLEGSSFKSDYSFYAKSFVDGNYLYYLKAYNVKTANKYLKVYLKVVKKKALIFKILKKEANYQKNLALKKYLELKIIQKVKNININ